MGQDSPKSSSSTPPDPKSSLSGSSNDRRQGQRRASDIRANNVRYTKSQERIDRINELVRIVKTEKGNTEAELEELVGYFEPIIRKVATHYFKQYGDLIAVDVLTQQARAEFIDLTLNAHTLGGPANFTYFINVFLFRRMQKYVAKERRYHYNHDRISYAEVQGKIDPEQVMVEDPDRAVEEEKRNNLSLLVGDILEAIYADNLLDDMERVIFEATVLQGKKDSEVAKIVKLSRPYVNRIHKRMLEKIRDKFGDRWQLIK